MNATASLATTVAWSSFVVAFVLGAISARTHFCTLGAISDVVNMGDTTRLRMWLFAIGLAIIGAQALYYFGVVDLSKSFYVRPNVTWLSYLLGGLMFGVGMTLASGCGSRTLVRIGGGNLKSVVVFVFLGIAAYMTMKGLTGVWRVAYLDPVNIDLASRKIPTQEIGAILMGADTAARKSAHLIVAGVIGFGLLAYALWSPDFRRSADAWLGGVGYGAAVVLGWYITAKIGYAENPETLEMTFFGTNSKAAESLTFVAPVAYTIELLMLWSDKSLIVSFGIASTLGMILGSLTYSLATRRFRVEAFVSAADMRSHIFGAVLMGVGGVTAMGCTIGQGISGVSTLAVGSILTLLSIMLGCYATLKYQYWRMMREE